MSQPRNAHKRQQQHRRTEHRNAQRRHHKAINSKRGKRPIVATPLHIVERSPLVVDFGKLADIVEKIAG